MDARRYCVFEYLYRDAGNYKAWGALLLRGSLTKAQVAEMRSKFEDGEFFIAEQLGVPTLYQELWKYSDGPTESDHPWHEFSAIRPAEECDLSAGPPWGTMNALFKTITSVTHWNERLSPCFGDTF